MPESSAGAPNLDERLAAIDRKLRSIQAELMPEREPGDSAQPTDPAEPGDPADPGDSGQPADLAEPTDSPRRGRDGPLASLLERNAPNHRSDDAPPPDAERLDQLTELHASLLASMTEVLDGFHRALAHMNERGREATMSAGPFATLEAVRAFERDLAGLASVAEVEIRGYEGEDRAVIAVRLASPTARPPTT